MTLILTIKNCLPYFDTEFIRQTFYKLGLGDISSIDTEMVTLKERRTKGNKLHDTKKTYYKNVYITYSKINEDKEIIKQMFGTDIKNSCLLVYYTKDDYWKVYKCNKLPLFTPIIRFSK
jgi:hypothetical protein